MVRTNVIKRPDGTGVVRRMGTAHVGAYLLGAFIGVLATGCTPSQPVPVLYWSFKEAGSLYAEKSGKLSAAIGTGTRSVPGVSGNAVSFPPGRPAYIELGVFNLPEYRGTLGMWLKPAPLTTQTHYHVLVKGFHGHTPGGWAFAVRLFRAGFLDVSNGPAANTYARSELGAIRFGTWQHMAISWSHRGVAFYVNGARVPTVEGGGGVRAVPDDDMPVALARWGALYYPEAAYRGEIDELKIYDRVLTPRQVAAAAKP